MDLAFWLSVTAASVQVAGFVLYNKNLFLGLTKPNFVTWALCTFLTVLNFTSYRDMSGDLVKSILPTVSSLACILTFVLILFREKRFSTNVWDGIALVIGLVSGFAWWWYHSSTYGNLILQPAIAVAFVPTLRGVWENPSNERALPWYIWSSAYILLLFVVFLKWAGQYQDLAYPVNCFILHAAVGVMASTRRTPAPAGIRSRA